MASTTRATSTTPAASRWSPSSTTRPTHEVVVRALTALDNLEHRGAEGADVQTGDGAGILIQLPHEFLRSVVDFELPEPGRYGVGICFLPRDPSLRRKVEELLELNVRVEGQQRPRLARRPGRRGPRRRDREPLAARTSASCSSRPARAHRDDQDAFERKLYVIRRIVELAAGPDFYAPSFSSRTIVYKGMLISSQLRGLLPRPVGRAVHERARARPLALQHEHVPELGARAPVPR